MKILFLIDANDMWSEMLGHRYLHFARMASSLANYHEIVFSVPIAVKASNIFQDTISCKYLFHSSPDLAWEWYGQYHLSALSDNFKAHERDKIRDYFLCIKQQHEVSGVDIVITNSPWTELRAIFNEAIVLNYELGIFNRKPLPIFHQFDPLGMYRKSLVFNAPYFDLRTESIEEVELLKREILSSKAMNTQKIDGIFFPFQSENNWPIRQECLGKSIPQVVAYLRTQFPKEKIYVTQKSNYPLSQETKIALSNIPNLFEIKGVKDSACLITAFEKIFSINSSLGFQAKFWNKELITLPNTSLSPWSGQLGGCKVSTIAALLETFWVRDEIISNSEQFSKRLLKIRKASKDILKI